MLQEIQNAQPEGSPVRSARYLRTLRLLRLLRLLRVAKLQQELTLLANNFLSTYAFMVMKVVSGLLMILAVNHIIACCWYGLGRWMLRLQLQSRALGLSVTASSLCIDSAGRFFAVLVILLAMGTFSSFISSITTTVSTLRSAREEQFKKHSFLVRFFNERNLSIELYGKVNDILRKQGAYDIRLKEDEVQLLSGVPERLKVHLHEEMFLLPLMSLRIWRYWKNEDDEPFFWQVCHLAMCEHIATPGQDAFMPGTECGQVYIIEAGSMGYIARQLTSFESEHIHSGEVFCLPCIWAEWLHRGRLTANTGKTCYYNGLDCVKFANLVKQHGSPLWQYLQIYGILLIGEVEHMDAEDIWVTDKALADRKMDDIAGRAQRFADIVNARKGHRGASFLATLGAMANTGSQHSPSFLNPRESEKDSEQDFEKGSAKIEGDIVFPMEL
ncbi:per1 [Symbiodinium pilosum]|uniref:Per1 protein n=1 Tax=Symbiodinium pilosum TaxID=2952 RepID=A0A812R607_SYMPI|nr:per1 [Symbiodinium pilosum]